MSEKKVFWESVPNGVHVGMGAFETESGTSPAFGHAFDPVEDREEAASLYADFVEDGSPALVLWVRKDGETLSVSDVTSEIREVVNAYLAARGAGPLAEALEPDLPEAFLTHIARWADGDLGAMLDFAPPNDEAAIIAAADRFVSTYGHLPQNTGVNGVVLLLERGSAGWSVREIAAAPSDAPRVVPGFSQ